MIAKFSTTRVVPLYREVPNDPHAPASLIIIPRSNLGDILNLVFKTAAVDLATAVRRTIVLQPVVPAAIATLEYTIQL